MKPKQRSKRVSYVESGVAEIELKRNYGPPVATRLEEQVFVDGSSQIENVFTVSQEAEQMNSPTIGYFRVKLI